MKKLLSILSLAVIAVDLWSKSWIESTLNLGESMTIIPGFFKLHYIRNFGGGWSILEGHQWIFLVLTPLVCLGLIYYFFFKENDPLHLLAIAAIFAGAAGNLFDRLVFGYVRDMFSFNIFGYDFPVFNVADMAVVFGVMIVIFILIREEVRAKHEKIND
ncbi:signal peptidase II [Erysipelothrix sp. HDW6C]|uniref:signal peptidase II n=1 Tax=Erysipelothrix sp. HDW6C TaxID=2714930 RepID=UPI00140BCAE3|nr:signal peptidase II [Erysipelothrix sp. HDW6C]QIK69876.1 signal peptidase II [Erysipelothrix sp. HDW6C]